MAFVNERQSLPAPAFLWAHYGAKAISSVLPHYVPSRPATPWPNTASATIKRVFQRNRVAQSLASLSTILVTPQTFHISERSCKPFQAIGPYAVGNLTSAMWLQSSHLTAGW